MWDEMVEEWSQIPGEGPTPEQRAAFEERLDVEIKRIQNEKRQIAQTHMLYEDELEDKLSTTHKENHRNLHNNIHRKNHGKSRGKSHSKTLSNILKKIGTLAAVLAVIILASFAFPENAIASGFSRILTTVLPDQGAEELRLEDKNGAGAELNPGDYEGLYMPVWIPKGFQAVNVINDANKKGIYYRNNKDEDICFEVAGKNYSVLVDDDNVTEETIIIHGENGKIVQTDSFVYIVWEYQDYLYSVSGEFNLFDDMMKMAEKCTIVGED